MPETGRELRVCEKGHHYYKSSDCPTCPKCEEERKPEEGILSLVAAPARRALERKHATTVTQLARYSEKEVLQWHGMGMKAIDTLKKALSEHNTSFKK
jgi:predicted RecB family nuclease